MEIPGVFLSFSFVDSENEMKEITERVFFEKQNVRLTKQQKIRMFSSLEAQCMIILQKVRGVDVTNIKQILVKIDLVYITGDDEFYLKPLPKDDIQVFFLIQEEPEVLIYKIKKCS